MVDTEDLKSSALIARAGSTPVPSILSQFFNIESLKNITKKYTRMNYGVVLQKFYSEYR